MTEPVTIRCMGAREWLVKANGNRYTYPTLRHACQFAVRKLGASGFWHRSVVDKRFVYTDAREVSDD